MGGKRANAVATGAASGRPQANTAKEPTTGTQELPATGATGAAPADGAEGGTQELLSTGTTEAGTEQPEGLPLSDPDPEAEPEAEHQPARLRVRVINHSGHVLTVKGVTEALAGLQLTLPPCGKSDSFEIAEQELPDLEEAVSFAQTSNYQRPGALQLHIEKAIK